MGGSRSVPFFLSTGGVHHDLANLQLRWWEVKGGEGRRVMSEGRESRR